MDQADIDRLWLAMQRAREKWTDASAEFDRSTKLFADLQGSSDGTLLLKKARETYSKTLREYTAAAKLYTEALRNFIQGRADEPRFPWQIPYQAALTELDTTQLALNIVEAERVIAARLCEPHIDAVELQALKDALDSLQFLRAQSEQPGSSPN